MYGCQAIKKSNQIYCIHQYLGVSILYCLFYFHMIEHEAYHWLTAHSKRFYNQDSTEGTSFTHSSRGIINCVNIFITLFSFELICLMCCVDSPTACLTGSDWDMISWLHETRSYSKNSTLKFSHTVCQSVSGSVPLSFGELHTQVQPRTSNTVHDDHMAVFWQACHPQHSKLSLTLTCP